MGILEIEVDGTTILVESSDISSETGKKKIGVGRSKVPKKFDDLLEVIKPISKSIIKTIEQMEEKPNSATAEFGLKFSVEGSLIFAKASAEAGLTVSLTWNQLNTTTSAPAS
jgi:hypothetical protein